MKLFAPVCATALVGLTLVNAGRDFKPNTDNLPKGQKPIRTAVNFGDVGGSMAITLGNSTVNQTVSLHLSRLEEVDPTGNVVQKSETFKKVAAPWTAMTASMVNNVSTMMTSLATPLNLIGNGNGKNTNEAVPFNLTANIYQESGFALNGNQSVPVTAGSLKFSITLGKWPFESVNNSLVFSVTLKANGRGGKSIDGAPKKHKSNKTANMDRLDLGEGMFMDAPSLAVADGKTVNVSSNVSVTTDVEFVWTMPFFNESLYYDPVLGSSDSTITGVADNTTDVTAPTPTPTTTTTVPTPTPTPEPTTTAPKSGAASSTAVLAVVAAITVAASSFFL